MGEKVTGWWGITLDRQTLFAMGCCAFTVLAVLAVLSRFEEPPTVRAAETDQAIVIAELRSRVISAEATAAAATGGADPMPESFPDVGAASIPDVGNEREVVPDWMPLTVRAWWPIITAAAEEHGVDPALVSIVMLVESGGDPTAGSGAGALGLMQVVPRWHPSLCIDPDCMSAYDPNHNVDVGTAYLAECMARHAGQGSAPDWTDTVIDASACYNGGSASNTTSETASYRRWVGGMWSERGEQTSPTFDSWMAAGGSRLVESAEAELGIVPDVLFDQSRAMGTRP